jgi:hypothetical protein
MRFNGQLEEAQLENIDGSPANLPDGRVWLDKTADKAKFYDGTATRSVVTEDGTQAVTNKTIVVASNTVTTAASGNLTSTNLNAALAELQTDIDTRALASGLSDHLADATDAHAGSAITNTPSGNLAATTVQGALNELQADVDTRATSASPTFSGTITTPLTASRAVVTGASSQLAAATTTATEIGYVNGVTSAIQTQLDAKQARSTLTTKGDLYVATASATVARRAVGSDGQVLTADAAETDGVKWATPAAASYASQADQEAGTSNVTAVTPGRQQYHASASKCWVDYNTVAATSISASYNVTSLTDNGTGNTTITIATDLSSANYASVASSQDAGSAAGCLAILETKTAGTLQIITITPSTLAAADSAVVCVAMFGDQ